LATGHNLINNKEALLPHNDRVLKNKKWLLVDGVTTKKDIERNEAKC
jgi:hypothetical protein